MYRCDVCYFQAIRKYAFINSIIYIILWNLVSKLSFWIGISPPEALLLGIILMAFSTSLIETDWKGYFSFIKYLFLGYATSHNHRPLSTTIHQQPKCQNISTTTQHHPPTAKIYPLPSNTTHRQPKYIHNQQEQSRIYPSKKVFYKKNINLF